MLGVFSSFNFVLWNVEEVCPRGKLAKRGISCLYIGRRIVEEVSI